tara:strand:- start:135 stop:1310 length:1176 start_codon:yes stop_codon:yes gene_type:complete
MGYFVPELGYQEYYLAKEHKKMGHDVYVITSDMLYPFPNIENMLKEAGVKNTSRKRNPGFSIVDEIKVYRLKHLLEYSDFLLLIGFKKTLEKIKPDVVFAHESRQGLPAIAAYYKNKFKYKFIVDQHDFYHKIPNHVWWKKTLRFLDYFLFRKFIVNFSLKRADRIIVLTDQTKNFLKNTHKIKGNKMQLIPLGVDTDSFKFKESSRSRIRKKHKIKEDEIAIVFAGTIVRRKGLDIIFKAFSELDNNKLKLLIVGNGEVNYVNELKELAKKLGIEKNTIFTGFKNKKEIPDYFSASDIGVWPGNNSVIIMEAMACKLPIVMVDLQLGYLTSFNNGFKFKENDKNALKERLNKLIRNKSLRKKMGLNSYNAIKKAYSYETISKKFLEVLKN